MMDNHIGAVAVVDDDPAVLDSLRFLLEAAGHRVSTYPSAMTFLADCGTPPACLILDQHMPQMTGLELVAKLHAAGQPTHILLITASASPEVVARAAQLGIEKVLEKPLNEDDLLGFVNAYH
jgi:two-component system, LuxR family, response regulator FixJ